MSTKKNLESGDRISIETRRMSVLSMARNMPISANRQKCKRQDRQQRVRQRPSWQRTSIMLARTAKSGKIVQDEITSPKAIERVHRALR